MARRSDPLNIYAAHRAGHLSRLVSQGKMSLDVAERWIVAWETEAALRGLDRRSQLFWRDAWDWIAEQCGRGGTAHDWLAKPILRR